MFAYIHNNTIFCIASEKLTEEFLENIENSESFSVLEFSPEIQNPHYDAENNIIIEALKSETETEKFERIFTKLISVETLEKSQKTELLEGVEFSDRAIGDLIQARVFENNPHAESAMQAKFSAWIASVVLGKPNTELKAEIDAKQAKINEVREFFDLQPLIF